MNIILIGMPGCGKTQIGKMLAAELGMRFKDCDRLIEEQCGMSIPEIFSEYGEKYFRDEESRVIRGLDGMDNAVIATGGGCVERQCNIEQLKKCGTVVFINRSVADIAEDVDVSGRPLLADTDGGSRAAELTRERLNSIYERRIALYRKCCDIETENSGTIDVAVKKITYGVKEYNG